MKNVVYLGSKKIGQSCLEFLIQSLDTLNLNLLAVFTKETGMPGSLVEFCAEHGVQTRHALDALEDFEDIDLIISVQHHQILKKSHIDRAKELAVNLHMAPLPEYRGCNQFSLAIINGDTEFGVTLHRLEPGIDSGAIIDEIRFPVPPGVEVTELYQLAYQSSIELFKRGLENIARDNYTLTPQEAYRKSRRSGFHLRSEIETLKQIDLDWDAEKIDRYIRALSMPGFEPPYTTIKGKKVFLVPESLYSKPTSAL